MEPHGGRLVVVDYQFSPEEFRRMLRWAIRRRPTNSVLTALGPLCIVLGLIFWGGLGSFVLGVGIGLLVLLLLSLSVAPAIAWRRNEWARGPRRLAISEEGVRTRTAVSEGLMQWTGFTASYETDQGYMLRMANRAYLVVPKRAIASAQDEAQLRQLLERHTAAHLWSPDHR